LEGGDVCLRFRDRGAQRIGEHAVEAHVAPARAAASGLFEPLAGEQVLPEPAEVYTYYAEYESRLWISFEMEPQTEYRVVLGKDISDRWGNHLPEDLSFDFGRGIILR